MPGKIIEKYWDIAKSRAEDQGKKENWPYVMAIYKNMTKNKKSAFLIALQKHAALSDALRLLKEKPSSGNLLAALTKSLTP